MKRIKLTLKPRPTDQPLDPALLDEVLAAAEAAIPPVAPATEYADDEERLIPDEQAETRLHEHVGTLLDDQDALLQSRAEKAGHVVAAQRELEEIAEQVRADAPSLAQEKRKQEFQSTVTHVVEVTKTVLVEGAKELFRAFVRGDL